MTWKGEAGYGRKKWYFRNGAGNSRRFIRETMLFTTNQQQDVLRKRELLPVSCLKTAGTGKHKKGKPWRK
jgi:hypothetical protein